jgi:DNA-binding CsgD family transcriptional regulator
LADTTDLIDDIYEAAVIPERWPHLLDDISRRTQSAFGTVFIFGNGVQKFVGTPESEKLVSDYVALDKPDFNSRIARSLSVNAPGFMTDADFFTEAEIANDPFYQDFMYPRGYGWVACTHFPLPSGDFVSVSFERNKSRGGYEPEVVAELDRVRPHFGRAAVLSARLGLQRASGMTEALGAVGIPGAVLKPNGTLYVANDHFQKLLPDVVLDRRERVRLADGGADLLLADAIARLNIKGANGQSRSIPLAAKDDHPAMIFHVVPVRGAANDIFSHGLALLIVTPVDKGVVPTAEVLQVLFDLTPAEARVARSIGEGRSIEAIALASGLSRETVRSQLAAVFGKTGVSRQAELAALLSGKGLPEISG